MRLIKKYANRKLYDTTDKRYISMDRLAKLIKEGEEVTITDNKSGEDLTTSIVSQLIARDKNEETDVPSGLLMQLLRKGGGTLVDYAKRYAFLWQSAVTMAEDEIDRLVNLLVKDKELSKSEGAKLKKEIMGYATDLKEWIANRIDRQVGEVLSRTNIVTRDHIASLMEQMDELQKKVKQLEKSQNNK